MRFSDLSDFSNRNRATPITQVITPTITPATTPAASTSSPTETAPVSVVASIFASSLSSAVPVPKTLTLALALPLSLSLVNFTLNAAPVCAAEASAKEAPQMTGLPFRKNEAQIERLPDGSSLVRGKIHGGKGFDAEVHVPRIDFNVKLDSPARMKDGHSDTYLDRKQREALHKAVYEILKERGYSYEAQKQKLKESGLKTQPEIWKEKTEATRKEIEKNGPITTKNFIVPGSTPEQSARLNGKNVGVRKENGKLVYYAFVPRSNGDGGYYERIDLDGGKKTAPAAPVARPVTTEKTKLRKSTKEGNATGSAPSSQTDKDAVPPQQTQPVYIGKRNGNGTGEGMGSNDSRKEKENVQRTFRTYITPQDDLRISPTDIPVRDEDLPKLEDMMKTLREHFPDAVPVSRAGSADAPGLLERAVIFLLGTSEALAQGVSEGEEKVTKEEEEDEGAEDAAALFLSNRHTEHLSDARKFYEETKKFHEEAVKLHEEAQAITEKMRSVLGKQGTEAHLQGASEAPVPRPLNASAEGTKEDGKPGVIDDIDGRNAAIRAAVSVVENAGLAGAGKSQSSQRNSHGEIAGAEIEPEKQKQPGKADKADKNTAFPLQPTEKGAAVGSIRSTSGSKSLKSFFDYLSDLWNSHGEIRAQFPDADNELKALREKHGASVSVGEGESDGADSSLSTSSTGEAPTPTHTYVFVSYSLSDDILLEILRRNHGRTDVTVVMRGIPETSEAAGGKDGDKPANILEGVMHIQNLLRTLADEVRDDPERAEKPPVEIIIDPALFREYGISLVPSVAVVGDLPPAVVRSSASEKRSFAKLLAKAEGLTTDAWVKEKLEGETPSGSTGALDLGTRGETFPILEPDLVEEMKRRASLIDWEAKKDGAVNRFWGNQKFTVLPTAKETRVREFEPVIIVEADVKDIAGNVIRRKGETLNLLEMKPFTRTMIIFNPTSEEEMERVEALVAGASSSVGEESARRIVNPMFIATTINSATEKNGWDFYEKLCDRLNAHVYTLTPEIRDTWAVERTPTVITADNTRHVFYVQEVGEEVTKEKNDMESKPNEDKNKNKNKGGEGK